MTAIASDMLRSYIDRILRLKAEQDDLAAGIREVYTEAKSNGFDKTAIGQVVTHVRKRDKKGEAELAEAGAIFDLYLSAYDGRPAPARARVEIIEEFPPSLPANDPVVTADPDLAGEESVGTERAASRKAPLESPGSPTAAEGLVSGRDRYVRGHATANVGQREHGQQTASSEGAEMRPLKAAEDMTAGETAPHSQAKASVGNGATVPGIGSPADSMSGEVSRRSHPAGGGCNVVMEDVTSRGGENPASNSSLDDSADGLGGAVGCTPKPASGAKTVPAPHTHSAPPSPPAPGVETPRAGSARTSLARGTPSDDDISIPAFLDRSNPDCIANRAQGRG